MNTAPEPADFLAQGAYDDEPDLLEDVVRRLCALEDHLGLSDETEARVLVVDAEQGAADTNPALAGALALIEEIRRIVKPSTSKVSLAVKAAIEAWENPSGAGLAEPAEDVGAPEAGQEPSEPHPDADVEAWRAYARQLGYGRTGLAFNDLEAMNRSQIRTLLGIEQPVGQAAGL